MNPLPNINQVYAMISQEAKQREIGTASVMNTPQLADAVCTRDNKLKPDPYALPATCLGTPWTSASNSTGILQAIKRQGT